MIYVIVMRLCFFSPALRSSADEVVVVVVVVVIVAVAVAVAVMRQSSTGGGPVLALPVANEQTPLFQTLLQRH